MNTKLALINHLFGGEVERQERSGSLKGFKGKFKITNYQSVVHSSN